MNETQFNKLMNNLETVIIQKEFQLNTINNELSETLNIFMSNILQFFDNLNHLEENISHCKKICDETKIKLIEIQKSYMDNTKIEHIDKYKNNLIKIKNLLILLELISSKQKIINENIKKDDFEEILKEYKTIKDIIDLIPTDLSYKTQLFKDIQKLINEIKK